MLSQQRRFLAFLKRIKVKAIHLGNARNRGPLLMNGRDESGINSGFKQTVEYRKKIKGDVIIMDDIKMKHQIPHKSVSRIGASMFFNCYVNVEVKYEHHA